MIFLKHLKFLLSLLFFEKYLDMMFDNVLNGKKTFLTSKTSFQHTHDFHQIFESSSDSQFP